MDKDTEYLAKRISLLEAVLLDVGEIIVANLPSCASQMVRVEDAWKAAQIKLQKEYGRNHE